jgi:TonB family protein
MRMRYFLVLTALFSTFLASAGAAQDQPTTSTSLSSRRIIRQTAPAYPEAAKRINLSGTVKVIALVASDGAVKSVEPVGGSPVLIKAAQDAVSQWKYAPGTESREPVELHFNLR